MTPKPVGYTSHARRQLKARHVTRQQVRWVLARGVRESLGEGVYSVAGYLGKTEAKLIVREDAQRILIITVMWVE